EIISRRQTTSKPRSTRAFCSPALLPRIFLCLADAAMLGFSQDQICGPIRSGMDHPNLAFRASDKILNGIHASMDGLGFKGTFKSAANDQHRGPMHQRPDREHEAVVIARISSKPLRQAFAHEIKRWPRLIQRRGLADAIEQHLVAVWVFESKLQVVLNGSI